MKVPRCEGSCELISTRTACGRSTALAELMVDRRGYGALLAAKALGSTDTEIVAGVTPLDGEMVMPEVLVDSENGV